MITITNEQAAVAIDTGKLEAQAQKLLSFLGYSDFDLGILLADSATMHRYNKKYRDKDRPTDILSFPYHDSLKAGETIMPASEDDKNVGDIILCPAYIQDDLKRWEQPFEKRMNVLLIHGILHLLGYDHIKDEEYEVMKQKEEELLSHLES